MPLEPRDYAIRRRRVVDDVEQGHETVAPELVLEVLGQLADVLFEVSCVLVEAVLVDELFEALCGLFVVWIEEILDRIERL